MFVRFCKTHFDSHSASGIQKTFDYKALSICVFSFYCHCAAGLHKTSLSKYAITLRRNIYKKVVKECKIEARNIDNHIWWQRRF